MNEAEFQKAKERQRGYASEQPKGVICVCIHCVDRWGAGVTGKCAMTCKNCGTIAGRKLIDEENEKIRKSYDRN